VASSSGSGYGAAGLQRAASALSALALAACGSHVTTTRQRSPSTTTPASITAARCVPQHPSAGTYVFPDPPAGCTAHLRVGNLILLHLIPRTSLSGPARRAEAATSLNPSVLQPARVPAANNCRAEDACSAFRALATGTVSITWTTSSGCQPGGPCALPAQGRMTVIVA
jgi:hypothetical protein